MLTKSDDRIMMPLRPAEASIVASIRDLKHGTVEVTVQNAKIIHLETKEKLSFQN